jgi:peptide deformylase
LEDGMVLKLARMGRPVLRARSTEVTPAELVSGEIRRLARDMSDTLTEYEGVGLAAPQVHVSKRVVLVDVPEGAREAGEPGVPRTVLVNPVVTPVGDEWMGNWEGCLSIPDLIGLVQRPRRVHVRYVTLDGDDADLDLEGFPAAVVQHEVDHLDGVLYIDRIRDLRTFQYASELARVVGEGRRASTVDR